MLQKVRRYIHNSFSQIHKRFTEIDRASGDNGIYFHRPLADETEAARAFIKRSSAVTLKLLAE